MWDGFEVCHITSNFVDACADMVFYSPFLEALFRLPDELHMLILRELCVADLLSLRRTSRVLNILIIANM